MNSISRAVVPLVAMWTTLHAAGCSSGNSTSSSMDAAVEGGSGGGSGSNSSGSTGSSGSGGSSGSTSSSGSGDAASGSSGAGDAGGDGGVCTTSSDCSGGYLCGFPESAGCSATGTCFSMPGATCNAIELGCACDGTSINLVCNGLPSGYTSKPYAHTGACGDASAGDAGPTDAGSLMDGAVCAAGGGNPCGAGLSCCPTAGYAGAPTACTPTCTGTGCAGSCRALP